MSDAPLNGNGHGTTHGSGPLGEAVGGLDLERLGTGGEPGTTSSKMLVPLFVVPLLIVGVIVGLFLAIGTFVGTEKTIEEWIAEVETGGVNGRWQAASSLTEVATRTPEKLADPALRKRLRDLFTVAGPSDTRLRIWLAGLWGDLGDTDALPQVLEGIERTEEALQAPEGRSGPLGEAASKELISYVRAVGRIGNSSSIGRISQIGSDSDPGVRMAAAEALGSIGRKSILQLPVGAPSDPGIDDVTAALARLHSDADAWVRMNAALALAKCGRSEGLPTLETMVDREWLRSSGLRFPDDGRATVNNHDPAEVPIASALIAIEEVVLGDRRAVESIDRQPVVRAVERAAADPNPRLQERAKALLAKLQKS